MSRVVIVSGTKSFDDYELVKKTLLRYIKDHYLDINDIEIVTGDVPGASRLGVKFAEEYRLAVSKFQMSPEKYGDAADWVRNEQMAVYAGARNGVVFAFWDGESQGTASMLKLAKKHNLEIHTLLYKGEAIAPKTALDVNGVFGLFQDSDKNEVVDNTNDLYDLDPSIRSF